MTTQERTNALIEQKHISVKTFAELLGVTPQSIYELKSGRTENFSPRMLRAIRKAYPNINPAWLLTGEGDMLKESPPAYEASSQISGNMAVVGVNNGQVSVQAFTEEVAAQRRLTEKAQTQIDRLLAIIERMQAEGD